VLEAPLDPEWAPEDREFKAKAQALLARRPSVIVEPPEKIPLDAGRTGV
jgi:hypothetical protein